MRRGRWTAVAAALVAAAAAPSFARAAGDALVAQARHATVPLYRSTAAALPYRRLGPIVGSYGTRPVFLVRRSAGPWLQVYLPTRPNHSTAWIRRVDVTVRATGYALQIQLRRHRLVLRSGARTLLTAPVGVGRSVTPTPSGLYFIAYVVRTGDPRGFFGPYAYGLSAYSSVFTSFAGGDGEVGLHGTSEPNLLGHDVSHGCIRLANAVITRLVHLLPLGTPVTIVR